MEVICLQDRAFYQLIDEVVERVMEKHQVSEPPWVSPEEAMSILNVKSKTTMQELRDTGRVRFSQPSPKRVVYSRQSLYDYLEEHAKETFK